MHNIQIISSLSWLPITRRIEKTSKSDFIACSTYLLTIVTGSMSHEPTPVDPDNMILNTNKKNKKKTIDTMNTTKPVESNNLCYCHITQIIHNPLFVKMGSITDQILHPTVWLCPLQNMDYIVVCSLLLCQPPPFNMKHLFFI